MTIWFKEAYKEIAQEAAAQEISRAVVALQRQIDDLAAVKAAPAGVSIEIEKRLISLEARNAELWNLLTEQSPSSGRPRLSKMGRSAKAFYGNL